MMGHQAGREFFVSKREWSRRKDQILGYYLVPYLQKIATQGRPVLLVDGFAGPGEFGDGEPGSPLIIARAAENARRNGLRVPIECMFNERDPELAAQLKQRVAGFASCEVSATPFDTIVSAIAERATRSSTFLYLDPFSVEGLKWRSLETLFSLLRHGLSLEILMNLNVHSLCRRGLAALQLALPADTSPGVPSTEPEFGDHSTIQSLNSIVGGDWWIALLSARKPYAARARDVIRRFCEQMSHHFSEVCFYEVREHWSHEVPKYVLVFGSRHRDALELMNDGMCKAREGFLQDVQADQETLFEMRPRSVILEHRDLRELVLANADMPMPRIQLVVSCHQGSLLPLLEFGNPP